MNNIYYIERKGFMGYLVFNEDLKTFAHNYIGSLVHGHHALNLKKN